MSIASEITRITEAKKMIVAAIEGRGVDVPDDARYDDFAELINQIRGGTMSEGLMLRQGEVVANRRRGPMITFTDDDGPKEFLTKWEPIIDEKGVPVSLAIITSYVGSTRHMSWDDLERLAGKGVEMMSHTHTHPLGSAVPNLTDGQIRDELEISKNLLAEHGHNAEVYVYPGGYHDARVRRLVRERYRAALQVGGAGANTPPLATYALKRAYLDTAETQTLDYFKTQIDAAISANGWIIFMGHSENATFNENTRDIIRGMIDYARDRGVDIVTVGQGLTRIGNVVDVGDTTMAVGAKYFIVDCDGESQISGAYDMSGSVGFGTHLSHFPLHKLVRVSLPNATSFPANAGILETWRDQNTALSYQMFYSGVTTDIYRRLWNVSGNAWGAFVKITATI